MTLKVLSLVGALAVLTGCGERRSVDPVQSGPISDIAGIGMIRFHVTYVGPSGARLAKPVVVDRMAAYVYESTGLEIARRDLRHDGNRGKAEIGVPAGDNRWVDLVAYEGTGVKWYGYDPDVDVAPGDTTSVDISMFSTVPRLSDPGDTTTVGSYSLSWSSVAAATGYVLEEDTTATFAGPRVAYSGSDTAVGLAGRGAGFRFYRVRAARVEVFGGQIYGEGAWSAVESIIVKPEGGIRIDVPWPPDQVVAGLPQTIIATLPGEATMKTVWIQAGTFLMGSPDSEVGRDDDEGPQHQVTITKGFYLGTYEVTQGQWESVMGTRPWSGRNNVQENPENPATQVSWDDTQQFVALLDAREGRNAYRLPTEAEWEYACRAGTTGRWSFGDDEAQLQEYAWYDANAWDIGEHYAHKVGTKLPNPWGLFDMHGNVWEWVGDWYGSYSVSAQLDPQGPNSSPTKIVRGGDFIRGNGSAGWRSADRFSTPSTNSGDGMGFRLLMEAP